MEPQMIEGLVAILIAIVTAAVIFGQLKENAKRNKEDIDAIKEMVVQGQTDVKDLIAGYQEDMKVTIEKYQEDMKDLIDEEKSNSRESLSREILHIRETLSMNINEIRDDIRRLEQNQNDNVRLREEVIKLKQSVKALHHRLDLESPEMLGDD